MCKAHLDPDCCVAMYITTNFRGKSILCKPKLCILYERTYLSADTIDRIERQKITGEHYKRLLDRVCLVLTMYYEPLMVR